MVLCGFSVSVEVLGLVIVWKLLLGLEAVKAAPKHFLPRPRRGRTLNAHY